jgi:anti-anti-sigma factor
MKRHHVAMAAGIRSANDGGAVESVAKQSTTASNENTTEQRIDLTPGAASPSPAVQADQTAKLNAAHTLVLVGELNRASTHTLEAEIERLCEAGIRVLTLDLSQLSGIDSAGVAVIGFRSKWCRKRGCDLALTRGSRAVQRTFELAGVVDALPFKESDTAAT